MTPANAPERMTDAEYTSRTSSLLAHIEATVDRWLEEDVIDIDTHRTGGLLELEFPGGTKIVLNIQPPLQELWLAAPSGGHHFRFVGGRWLDTRNQQDFFTALSASASELAGQALEFSPPR